MTDIKAIVRVEHPDIVLTETVTHDRSSTVRSVSEAGTDPTSGKFFYHIESSDFSGPVEILLARHLFYGNSRSVDVRI